MNLAVVKTIFNRIDLVRLFAALRHRNYRLFFVGQGISNIGTWMQKVAVSWLAYRITGSVFMLGFVGFAGQIPSFAVAPFAGVLADRYPRKLLLIIIQSLAMLQALILSILVLTHTIQVWQIVALSLLLGLINACDIPVRQSFTTEMVEEQDLGNAIALNSSMVNLAKLIGPSVAGVLIALVGEGMCFVLNALSYLAVIASLVAMSVTAAPRKGRNTRILQELKEGFSYARGSNSTKQILVLLAVAGLTGQPYISLLSVFAKDVLGGGPHTLGFLMASSGVGALLGALYLAGRNGTDGLAKRIACASAIFGAALMGFTLSRRVGISMLFLVMVGLGMMVQLVASNTVLQTTVNENMRGRVMSFYTMAHMGMNPFGSLLAGIVASKIGAPQTLFFGGLCCVIASMVFARRAFSVSREAPTLSVSASSSENSFT